ncbi:MAG: ABC transporter ATP-binding protein, partial [Clostridia bacterium]|nr:ABC transporter ATP-binding protein [Clostridia bacterium]
YTISLLSAVPMPDPIIEKPREPIVYTETEQEKTGPDYAMREIRPGHFVYCTPEQAKEYAEVAEHQ